jgi:hypothetical protein
MISCAKNDRYEFEVWKTEYGEEFRPAALAKLELRLENFKD